MAHVTSDSRSDNIPCVFVNIEQHDMHMHTHVYADVDTREWKSLRGMIFARNFISILLMDLFVSFRAN